MTTQESVAKYLKHYRMLATSTGYFQQLCHMAPQYTSQLCTNFRPNKSVQNMVQNKLQLFYFIITNQLVIQ